MAALFQIVTPFMVVLGTSRISVSVHGLALLMLTESW